MKLISRHTQSNKYDMDKIREQLHFTPQIHQIILGYRDKVCGNLRDI